MASFDLAEYRRRAEEFTGALDLEAYQHFAGLKADCDFTAVYDRFPELFTLDSVRTLRAVYDAATGDDERRCLSFLLNLGIEGFLGNETKELSDEIANTESRATSRSMAKRSGCAIRASCRPTSQTATVAGASTTPASSSPRPCSTRSTTAAGDVCTTWSASSATPPTQSCSPRSAPSTSACCAAPRSCFLQATEGLYQRTLDKVSRAKLGLPRTELEQADLPFLVRAPEYDHIFASDKLLPTFERTLQGLGVSLADQPNVHVDAEVRELKSPRAFCAPVRIPEEIYLVVMPKGGQDDFQALLHEGGHTEHFAHTEPRPALRVPLSGRQRGHRGLRLRLRPPHAQRAVARDLPRLTPTRTST